MAGSFSKGWSFNVTLWLNGGYNLLRYYYQWKLSFTNGRDLFTFAGLPSMSGPTGQFLGQIGCSCPSSAFIGANCFKLHKIF
jgi:hypothetical protein